MIILRDNFFLHTMPELPEIAQNRKFLDATVLHKSIKKVEFPQKKLLQAPEEDFRKVLLGDEFAETAQLGKYLFLKTTSGKSVVFHFGMTGKLEAYHHQEHPKYAHMIISFADSSSLTFVCRRKLGKIFLSDGVSQFREQFSLGQDAMELNADEFAQMLEEKRGGVKTALTDQHFISGIGNVYADEILYQSHIHPKSKIEKLSRKEKEELFANMKSVLELAINNEGKRNELPEDYLTPHRKEGADCPKCSGKIEMIKVSGRSTYFCPSCQQKKS